MSKGERKLYTTKQAAEYLGKSIITIKRAVRDNHLTGDLLNDRMRVFTKDELDQYAEFAKTIKRGPKPKGQTG